MLWPLWALYALLASSCTAKIAAPFLLKIADE
jgi:hypothetical protein